MYSLHSLKYAIPLGLFGIGSYFANNKGSQSGINFHDAAIAQVGYASELQENPISNQTYWKSNIGKIINSGPSLLDGKIGVDFLTTSALAGSHIALGMLSVPYALLPAVVYIPSTANIFYAERTRSAEFSDVIQGLYTPDCSVDSFKATLAAASKVGSSKSPSEYAQFISTVYKIEDATNIAQLGTVVGGLWATYKTAGVAAIKSSEGSITKLSSSSLSDSAQAQKSTASTSGSSSSSDEGTGPYTGTSSVKMESLDSSTTQVLSGTTPLDSDSSGVSTSMLFAINYYIAIANSKVLDVAGYISEKIVEAGDFVYSKSGATPRDIGIAGVTVIGTKAIENGYSVYSNAGSEIGSVLDLLSSERSISVGKYVLAREEVRKMEMEAFLQLRFETCSEENPKINDDFIGTYTTQSCSEGDVFSNLLSGKDGCMFTNPELLFQ
jgi:hypothetical protein